MKQISGGAKGGKIRRGDKVREKDCGLLLVGIRAVPLWGAIPNAARTLLEMEKKGKWKKKKNLLLVPESIFKRTGGPRNRLQTERGVAVIEGT